MVSAITRQNTDVEAGGSAERWRDLEVEAGQLLEKLEVANRQLGTLTETPDKLSPSMLRAIQRHVELLQDNRRDLARTKANINQSLDQANLLAGVRNDIDAYKSSAADALLAERGRIDSSHRMTDDILSQAYETRSEFTRQRVSLAGINNRMVTVLNGMPGLNNLISLIKSRRRRDSIILGLLIGFCAIIILAYLWQ